MGKLSQIQPNEVFTGKRLQCKIAITSKMPLYEDVCNEIFMQTCDTLEKSESLAQ